jgi:hypothetical protein
MSNPFDPGELDLAWDSMIAGSSSVGQSGEEADRDLLALLGTLPHSVPNSHFVHTLERALFYPVESMNGHHTAAIRPTSPQRNARRRSHLDFGGWMPVRRDPMRYMNVAIALVLVLSLIAIALQRQSNSEPVIPAASQWSGQGPSTSVGVDTTTLFSHAYTQDELQRYASSQWSWIELTAGTIRPGERPTDSTGIDDSEASSTSGMYTLTATGGELTVELNGSAQLFQQREDPAMSDIGTSVVTLRPGDTLVYPPDTIATLWNASNEDATFLVGALTTYPAHFKRPERTVRSDNGGNAVPTGFAAGEESLDISLSQVVLDPGETFAYTISPQTLLLAQVSGGLQKQAWVDGKRFGKPLNVLAKVYILSNYGTGYFTLTNPGSKSVTVALFSVAPPDTGVLASPPAEPIDSPFGAWSLTQPVAQPAPIPE